MKKEDLKIVFFGTPEFAVASLDRIVEEYLREYKMFTQTAYNESFCAPPIHKKVGAV